MIDEGIPSSYISTNWKCLTQEHLHSGLKITIVVPVTTASTVVTLTLITIVNRTTR